VHHKIKRSQRGNDSLENLVSLCAYCHMAEHGQLFYSVLAVRVCNKLKTVLYGREWHRRQTQETGEANGESDLTAGSSWGAGTLGSGGLRSLYRKAQLFLYCLSLPGR
jgi:hypothetical protein